METRIANWPLALNAKVDEWRVKPFEWGISDCCQFLAEVAHSITGVEHRAKFPAYTSKDEATVILERYGGMHGLLTHAFGESKPHARAHRGDGVIANFGEGPTAGVCLGVYCCAPGPRGLQFIPMSRATDAWSI